MRCSRCKTKIVNEKEGTYSYEATTLTVKSTDTKYKVYTCPKCKNQTWIRISKTKQKLKPKYDAEVVETKQSRLNL